MKCTIGKYKEGRNWGVWLLTGEKENELIAVTVYKKGAESVKAITDALIKTKANTVPAQAVA